MTFSTIWRALDSNAGILLLGACGFLILMWKVSAWKANMENRLSGVEKAVKDFSRKIDEVYSAIIGSYGRPVERAGSPVTLTEYGMELSGKIDAEKIVDRYADKLHRKTEQMNAYKVQEQCFLFCKEELLDDLEKKDKNHFDQISNLAYEEGIHNGETDTGSRHKTKRPGAFDERQIACGSGRALAG